MILLPAIIGVGAAILLLTAGYLFGVKRGYHAREQLRRQNLMQAAEMEQLPEQLLHRQNEQDDSLRATIQQVLTPLVQREQLSHEFSHLEARLGHHSDLMVLSIRSRKKATLRRYCSAMRRDGHSPQAVTPGSPKDWELPLRYYSFSPTV